MVVVYENNLFPLFDKETEDSYLVYANAPHRIGKTIRVDRWSVEPLLKKLKKLSVKHIKLIFLGHTADSAMPKMAGMSIDDMNAITEKYDNIKKSILFGCETAVSKRLGGEEKMIRSYAESQIKIVYKPCGFLLMSKSFSEDYSDINKMLNSIKLDASYILIKDGQNGNEKYMLWYTERLSNDKVSSQLFPVNQENILQLQKIITSDKDFIFPSSRSKTFQYYKPVCTSQKPLTEKQAKKIFAISQNIQVNLDIKIQNI